MAFARVLNVDRTCLSRYESEKLGAPTRVINYCLARVAALGGSDSPASDIDRALLLAKEAVQSLERVQKVRK